MGARWREGGFVSLIKVGAPGRVHEAAKGVVRHRSPWYERPESHPSAPAYMCYMIRLSGDDSYVIVVDAGGAPLVRFFRPWCTAPVGDLNANDACAWWWCSKGAKLGLARVMIDMRRVHPYFFFSPPKRCFFYFEIRFKRIYVCVCAQVYWI